MQLTRLDRWLLEEFVHETHVYTISPVATIPRGIREKPMPHTPGGRFHHHYVASDTKSADALVRALKESGQMFSTKMVDRNAWYVPWIAPRGKSITWRVVWIIVLAISLFFATQYFRKLISSPSFRENFAETLKILQG